MGGDLHGTEFQDEQVRLADADALEALVDAGYDIAAVPAELRDRAERVARVLGLLDTPHHDAVGDDETLIAATVLEIERRGSAPEQTTEARLSAEDADALDALVFAGYDAERVPVSLRARAEQHAAVGRLLSGVAVDAEGDPGVTDRALSAVQAAIDSAESSMRIEGRRGVGFGWREVVSVAAMLLIGASVVLPITSQARHLGQTSACASNLASAARAFGQYGIDHADQLPVAAAGFGARGQAASWWNVGRPGESNAANLYHLVPTGYAALAELGCPGNAHAQSEPVSEDARDFESLRAVSFSYRLPTRSMRFVAPDAASVVLADRSPVILAAAAGRPIDPFANSTNHRGRGQHVLLGDGSVRWLRSATLDTGDNIWLPRTIESGIRRAAAFHGVRLEGRELPESADDVFVGP